MRGDVRPTVEVRKAVNRLLRWERPGAEVGEEMFLGEGVLVVMLRKPTVIEGEWREGEQTGDIFDLMTMHESDGSDALSPLKRGSFLGDALPNGTR